MAGRNHLDLDNYLPYLINRVGFALVESFTAEALTSNGLSIAMWRVLAAEENFKEIEVSGLLRESLPMLASWEPPDVRIVGEQ